MIGAIIGDIAGSRFEFDNYRKKDFEIFDEDSFFTDDSVMTLALAKSLLESDEENLFDSIVENFQEFGRRYPDMSYGNNFYYWLRDSNPQPYNSIGNGSAMRVSPVGWLYDSLDETLEIAKLSADVTHNSEEGGRGAQATAAAIYLARTGKDKDEIINYIKDNFYDYDFLGKFTIDNLRDSYGFGETCDTSVPHALEAFFEGEDFEDVIRTAVSLGGDSDTIAAIAGSIAEAYYGVPEEFVESAYSYLDQDLIELIEEFNKHKK